MSIKIDADTGEEYFVCYHCIDGDHKECVGASCHCPCELPDQRADREARSAILAKLTDEEKRLLGVYE